MQVKKILNNNLILVEDPYGHEQIVMGRGLRFINQVGEELKNENIQKVFVLQDKKTASEWVSLLEHVPDTRAEAIQEAIYRIINQMKKNVNDQLFITLFDHLVFTLERYEKKVILQNRLLWEVRQFYPEEFALGLQLTEELNRKLEIELPEEEAGNIAFHLVNAQTENPDMEHTLMAVRMLKDIFNIVESQNPVFSMLSSTKCRNNQEINGFSTLSDTLFYPLFQSQKYLQYHFHSNLEGYRKSTVRSDNC